MKTATLTRQPSTDQGTFGTLTLPEGWSCATGELPSRGNQTSISCIPRGTYTCHWIDSPKHGECYQVMNVPNRSMIEIHSANFMGDKAKGYKTHLEGCIALGECLGMLDGQMALLKSKATIAEFERRMNKEDFILTITGGNHGN